MRCVNATSTTPVISASAVHAGSVRAQHRVAVCEAGQHHHRTVHSHYRAELIVERAVVPRVVHKRVHDSAGEHDKSCTRSTWQQRRRGVRGVGAVRGQAL
jgi:hypothetical protein